MKEDATRQRIDFEESNAGADGARNLQPGPNALRSAVSIWEADIF